MVYYPTCENIVSHECNVCETELGRIRSAALIHKSYYATLIADVENVTLWDNGIEAGLIYLYPSLNGSYDGGVPKYSRGFASAPETLLAYNFSCEITDPNYQGNLNHWGRLAGNKNYYIAFCSETIMSISTRVCNILPKNPIDNDLKKQVTWNVQFKWVDLDLPIHSSIPDGIFECEYVPPIKQGIGWMTIGTTNIVG